MTRDEIQKVYDTHRLGDTAEPVLDALFAALQMVPVAPHLPPGTPDLSTHKDWGPDYTNVVIYIARGSIQLIAPICGGHNTMEEAIECAEHGRPKMAAGAALQQKLDPSVTAICAILKTTPSIVEITDLSAATGPRKETQ